MGTAVSGCLPTAEFIAVGTVKKNIASAGPGQNSTSLTQRGTGGSTSVVKFGDPWLVDPSKRIEGDAPFFLISNQHGHGVGPVSNDTGM